MEIRITKRDVIWNYIAQFFNLGSGLIVLPVVLHLLSPEEVGMNYLMLSVSTLVALADFGFSDQFGRNITYVFCGAQELKKEGMSDLPNGEVDYHLLSVVIATAKTIYKRISLFVFFMMVTFGSIYIYRATGGFTTVQNSLYVWFLFSISTYFEMYFKYYGSLLSGAAMIMESKKAVILTRIAYIVICFSMLFAGFGLISIVVGNLISSFIGRWYSYRMFYNREMKTSLLGHNPNKKEIEHTFDILWYNAKKLGINFMGTYGIQQSGTFIIGLFLPLSEVASYGLMCQLYQIAVSLSTGFFTTLMPKFYKERVEGDLEHLVRDFSFTSFVFVVGFSIMGFVIINGGNTLLKIIGSQTYLPAYAVMIIYFLHLLLENFHSMCATMIVTNNQVPFVKAALVSGVFIVLSNLLTLRFTSLGLLGVVLGQFIVQCFYNHWKWPLFIFNEFELNLLRMMKIGFEETIIYIGRILR